VTSDWVAGPVGRPTYERMGYLPMARFSSGLELAPRGKKMSV
jgi:hypothetical protein